MSPLSSSWVKLLVIHAVRSLHFPVQVGCPGTAAQANEALLTRSVDGRRQRILTSIVPNDNQIYRVIAESDYLQRKPRRPLLSL
jgi:hypothetical protein